MNTEELNALPDEAILAIFAEDFLGSDRRPDHYDALVRRVLQIIARRLLAGTQL